MSHPPKIQDLPPTARTGWPWSTASEPLPTTLPDGSPWPKISIVTPSFNQANYLEETIRSVLLQGYPNLEYIVIDGGSTDGSAAIIKKYEQWLHFWVSEKDDGQSQAINKGFEKCSGEIMAWINSDDYYEPQAFTIIAKVFLENKTLWTVGITHKVDTDGQLIQAGKRYDEKIENWYVGAPYLQPGIFWRCELWQRAGKLDETLNYSFDYDLLMRFIQHQPFALWINHHLANFRIHPHSKTSVDQLRFMEERKTIYRRYPLKNMDTTQKFYIWKMRRERQARIFMKLDHETLPFWKKLFRIFCVTPWFFTRINFLYWIKRNL